MSGVRVLVGTKKGAFILSSDGTRKKWAVQGPLFSGWEIYHMKGSPADPNRIFASQSSGWFGQIMQRSSDGGKTWETPGGGPGKNAMGWPTGESNKFVYDKDAQPITTHQWYDGTQHPWDFKRVWHVEPDLKNPDICYAGVEDAGLFKTSNGGRKLAGNSPASAPPKAINGPPVPADSASTPSCSIPPTPTASPSPFPPPAPSAPMMGGKPSSLLTKGCATITCRTRVRRSAFACTILFCILPSPARCSCNFTRAAGRIGATIAVIAGRKSKATCRPTLAFPSKYTPMSPIPSTALNPSTPCFASRWKASSKSGRSKTGGNDWEPLTKGLPQENCFIGILRDAMAVDTLDDCGVYFGTTGGQVYCSPNGGDSWQCIVHDLPHVLSVEVQTLA